VAVQGGERDVVEIDEAEPRDARAREHDSGPAADAAAADYDDRRFAHARDALFAQEGIVSGQLFAHEFFGIICVGSG